MLETMKGNPGFTLVEVVIYSVLLGVFSTVILINLRSAQTNSSVLERASAAIISDLRRAQNLAIAGLTFQGQSVCGYGLHYLSPDSYLIYTGGEGACSSANRNYQSGTDLIFQTIKIVEGNVKFKSSFGDVFFEPPDPKTYLNNRFSLSEAPLVITVGFENQSCPSGCKTIAVFPSGKIDFN
ncbi:MAG: hypothetical protein A3I92_01345 [Candidatus Yanofskybacteria bacterium RIFCSPLOWO2_02_FULL_43_10b]|uniref:General secretion pathway GspH domain-containing protein n=1 Tax=Candidatus Yanofskybacteria bacterium RIFCSPLOWO2_02_FULL_43_10b TaxID=1802704 RepID=A0A1F8GZ33_9BACT|nr:MAG: hypothetical protein A3I92_01345 [Candidatus Yanofskybacteria bacterium RIFCSPLOWO2_02_FULL_43_10b]